MNKLKIRQKDQEASKLVQDLAKEKEDDKKARDRVKAQITKDREERAAKYHKERDELEALKQEKQQRLLKEQEQAETLASQRRYIYVSYHALLLVNDAGMGRQHFVVKALPSCSTWNNYIDESD